MTSIERTIIEVLVALAMFAGFALYEQHRGAKECVQAEATVVANAEVHNTQVEAVQVSDDKKAGDKLNASLSNPIGALPPVTSLQPQACPSPVPSPRSNPSPRPASPVLRAPETPSVVPESWSEFERSDVQSSRAADLEITYLHDLLQNQFKLCGGKPSR